MFRNLLLSTACAIVGLLGLSSPIVSQTLQGDAPAWTLVDLASGAILLEKNKHQVVNPGELTCLMTLYTALTLSRNAPDAMQTPISITHEDAQKSHGLRRIYLIPGASAPLETLLHAIAVVGAEDAALAVASHFTQQYGDFVGHMNRFAKQLGMNDSKFVSPIAAPGQQTSAHDLSILAVHFRHTFPLAFKWAREKEFSYSGHKQRNCNLALWKDPEINGLFTNSNNTDVLLTWARTSQEHQTTRELLTIVLNGKKDGKVFETTADLLRVGRTDFETLKIFNENTIIAKLDVLKGSRDKVDVGVRENVWISIRRKVLINRGAGGFSTELEYERPLIAPIHQGDRVGTLHVRFENQVMDSIPVYAMHDVGLGGAFSRFVDSVRMKIDMQE